MLRTLISGLLLAWILAAAPCAQAESEDAAWIERYMASHASAPRGQRDSDPGIAFNELKDWVGERLRFRLHSGRERSGVLERADGHTARLRVTINGGQFGFELQRAQVKKIIAETIR